MTLPTAPDSAAPAIEVRGLRKSYGRVEAVRGVDLRVAVGEVFALLGPNGAGKTTTVEILEGYLSRTGGEVSVLGFDPSRPAIKGRILSGLAGLLPGMGQRSQERRFKERIGIVLQSTGVDPYLNVQETINLFRGYYPDPLPLEDVLTATGLAEQRRVRVRKLSGGQQRRLDVAVGLAGNPDLLFLDEPTTGFDPSARRDAWEMVRNLKQLGKTVLLTTHYMDEAEHLADRLAIMVRGENRGRGDSRRAGPARRRDHHKVWPGDGAAPRCPRNWRWSATGTDGRYTMLTDTPTESLHRLTAWAVEQGHRTGATVGLLGFPGGRVRRAGPRSRGGRVLIIQTPAVNLSPKIVSLLSASK